MQEDISKYEEANITEESNNISNTASGSGIIEVRNVTKKFGQAVARSASPSCSSWPRTASSA